MSDMSPNISGIPIIDMSNSIFLWNLSLNMCNSILTKKGIFLIKVFQGSEYKNFVKKVKKIFKKVKIHKLNTSRSKSREVYIIAKGKFD